MIEHDGAWLPSIWAGIPVIVLGFAACLVVIYALHRRAEREDDREEFWMISWMPIIAGLALIITPAIGYWPYSGDYHRLQPTTGVVESVDTRFLAASQYVVVTYRGGLIVRCDDSRCATVKPGEQLRLLCTKEWEYGAVNGWGCRWGQTGRP